ncbi:MAG TPA: trigger factor [Candidatus Avanaerovorax faecigallinarum]|nr:trigger factor [Candidatus Avanaerovorax faecigallinarum]
MKTTFISKENNEVKFKMEFTKEEFNDAIVEAYKATKNQFVIDGFRRGKAPRSIIEKHYGEGVFFEDAINSMLDTGYPQAVKELELEVIDRPDMDFEEIAKDKDVVVNVTVAVYPVVEVKDYMGVEVEQPEFTADEADADKELESMRKRNARMIVAERAAEDGDTVILDYAGFVGDEQFEGGTAESQELKLGSGMFIPGFEEQLVGVKAGEKKDVKVTFPEEYHAENLAGKEAVFHCTVHEVKEEQLPELDDEFAKDVSEYDTLKELKDSIIERNEKMAADRSVNAGKDAVIKKVYELNKPEVPRVMVEDEMDRMMQEIDQELRYQGMNLQQYLGFIGQDYNAFREDARENATEKVGTRLVLMSIVDAENVEISEEELEAELKNLAEAYKSDVDKVKEMIGEDGMVYFKKDMQLKKVIDLLYDKASVKKVKPEEIKPEVTEVEK